MKKLLTFFLIQLILQTFIFAAHPEEMFFPTRDDLPKDLLKKTVAILTLNSGIKGGITLDLFDDSYIRVKSLNIRDNSSPISNYGYHPPVDTLVSNYRFSIVQENENYIKVVFDFKSSEAYWVDKKELNDKFYAKIQYMNQIQTKHAEFISLFGLADVDQRKIYTNPSETSDYKTISREDSRDKYIKVVDQKGDFIKIALAVKNKQLQTEEIGEILGWIKIRDDQGSLNIWIIKIDLFG